MEQNSRSFEKPGFKTLIKANVVMPVGHFFFALASPIPSDVSAQGSVRTSEAIPDLPSACVPVAFLLFLKVFSFSLSSFRLSWAIFFPETSVLSFHLLLLLHY